MKTLGNKVYFRGLIELSNVCEKDCLYCGIRKSNSAVDRYNLADEEVLDAARFAYRENYGSLVVQSGEVTNETFVARIERLIVQIKELSGNKLGITLSLGETNRIRLQALVCCRGTPLSPAYRKQQSGTLRATSSG